LRAAAVTVLIATFLAGAADAQPAKAQAVGPVADIRCMLTMAQLSNNKANQPQAGFGLFYFAGRIRAQSPNFNFGTDLKPVAVKMTAADFEAETKRCGPMVVSVFQGLQAAQASMAPPAAAAPPAAGPAKK
jgi:hypothetical protein